MPAFDRFCADEKSGNVKGGILTDGFSFSLYGKRLKSDQQRTENRTSEHLRERGMLDRVRSFLNPAVSSEFGAGGEGVGRAGDVPGADGVAPGGEPLPKRPKEAESTSFANADHHAEPGDFSVHVPP